MIISIFKILCSSVFPFFNFLCVFLLFIVFAICLGFYLFGFFSSFFLFSLAALCRLLIPQPERGQAWATGGGVTSPGHWAARERLDPGNIN